MATYKSIAAWEGRAQPSAPVLLWDYDAVALATQTLAGVTSLVDGSGRSLAVTTANTGSPTTWESTQGTGIRVNGGTAPTGNIDTTWAAISTLMEANPWVGRALEPEDTIIIAAQWTEATGQATVTNTRGAQAIVPATLDNYAICRIGRFDIGATIRNTQFVHFNGATIDAAIHADLSGARSTTIWIWGGGQSATGFLATDLLSDDEPLRSGTPGQVLSTTDRAHSGDGAFAPTATADFIIRLCECVKQSAETVTPTCERIQVFVSPGSPP